MDAKGYDNIGAFGGGEEAWGLWSWKMKVATRAMSQELGELMVLAETHHGKTSEELLEIADADENYDTKGCLRASAELFSFLTRFTKSEAATVVKGAKDMDGLLAYSLLHENYSKRTLGRMFRMQRECMYPRGAKDLAGVKIAIMQWEERWKRMKGELGVEVKIPDLWRMSALLEICPQDLKEQMMLRLDEVGEDYEALKSKIVSYATNKVEQTKSKGPVPMELDYVQEALGYEYEDEEVDAVWPTTQCYECKGYGHFARDCPAKGKGKGGGGKGGGKEGWKGGGGKDAGKGAWGKDGGKGGWGKGAPKGGYGTKGFGKGGKGGYVGGYQGTCWRCWKVGHKAVECVAALTEEGVEEIREESEECGGVWTISQVEEEECDQGPPGLGGGYPCGGGCSCRVDQFDHTLGKEDFQEYSQSSGRRPMRARGSRRMLPVGNSVEEMIAKDLQLKNQFAALQVEHDDEPIAEVTEECQEVVEVTVDSGASKSVWPIGKKGVERTKGGVKVKLAAANGSPIKVEGEAKLHFKRGGRRCEMRFLDADVRRPLAAVSAIVDEGNDVHFSKSGSYILNVATGERIPMVRRKGVYVIELEGAKEKVKGTARMEVDEVTATAAQTATASSGEGDMIFKHRLSEEEMGVFQRRA